MATKTASQPGPDTGELLDRLQTLAGVASEIGNRAGIRRAGEIATEPLREIGFTVTSVEASGPGHLVLRRAGPPGGPSIFLCAHLDTVLAPARPLEVDAAAGRLYGQGVADCKGGIVVMVAMLESLAAGGTLEACEWRIVLNGDEETGSTTSHRLIEEVAAGAGYALVFEPARPSGQLVMARKGHMLIDLVVRGQAAHAGVDHRAGRSAIEELAHKILAIQGMTDYAAGILANVGVVGGGRARNVIADLARAELELRFDHEVDRERVDRRLDALCARPAVPGTETTLERGLVRPAWPPDAAGTRALTEHWVEVAKEIGLDLSATASGGGSDANWTARLEIPTLDGLGPVGGGFHTVDEYVEIESLRERAVLNTIAIERLIERRR